MLLVVSVGHYGDGDVPLSALSLAAAAFATVRPTSPSKNSLRSAVQVPTMAPHPMPIKVRVVSLTSLIHTVIIGVRKPMVPYSQGAREAVIPEFTLK